MLRSQVIMQFLQIPRVRFCRIVAVWNEDRTNLSAEGEAGSRVPANFFQIAAHSGAEICYNVRQTIQDLAFDASFWLW